MLSFNNFFGEEKFSWLPARNKLADEKTENYNLTIKFLCPWKWKFSTDTLFLEGSQLPAELHKKSFLRIWAHFSRRKKVKCASQRQSPEKYFSLIRSLSTKVQIDSYPQRCQTDFEVLKFLNYQPFKNL